MYTVASATLGETAHLAFLVSLARVWVWVGVAAWASVLSIMLVALARAVVPGQATPATDRPSDRD